MKDFSKYSAIIIGAGDATGSALCKKFALNGYKVCAVRRPGNLDKFKQLENDIKEIDGWIKCFGVDAREEESIQDLFKQVEEEVAPIDVVIFNPGANVFFPIEETTSRVFRKVWEMAKKQELKNLKFREKDFFQEIPEAFNLVVDSFDKGNKS